MKGKDWVSWNLIICGYGQLGHGIQAIELFEEMRKQKVRPNSITFLRVLSSCRHAVDLPERACLLEEAGEFIKKMSIQPNGVIWGSLLMSCRLLGNFWLGTEAAENRLVVM
ncbi:hypothetical protein FXO38_21948 [Capsicum annuum]|uniref:Pentatricopeptide repeat-containing protein n=1 Tax=Capsicum annuum TaxID=4072 RepID=A0A2G2ZN25_CAPAN|nr:hypothetical protein FXO37_30726 [Capsicum annuum]KAF3640785.1 hypothetical protein FXO38_21948 [Capsicum annuum]PHT83351.1 hypothetical protein T459_11794 [Capsicum annuum]